MGLELLRVKDEEKEILYRLLQFALYDGSFYINNTITDEGIFQYTYFEDYFSDKTRDKYFIKYDGKIAGFVMINENNQFNNEGKTIAEFLILPYFRRKHIGKIAAIKTFEMYPGNWEVQPMENNLIAYSFWKNVISEYTNGNYITKSDGLDDIFIFYNE